jgi:hypothetical protein
MYCDVSHGQTGAERNDQEGDRKADRDRRHRRGTQPAYPERIGQLVAGLQDVGENDGEGQAEQRTRNGSFEKERLAVIHLMVSLH